MSAFPNRGQDLENGRAPVATTQPASLPSPTGTDDSSQPPLAPALLTAILLALILPAPPQTAIDTQLDSSWQAVLSFAHQHRLQFGTDIVFPFGPLGFLFIPGFTGDPLGSRLLLDFAVNLVIAVGICLLAWRMSLSWRLLLLGALAAVFIPIDTRFEMGLLCWALLCFTESEKRASICRWALAGLAAALALWKFSLLLIGAATLLAVACWLLHDRKLAAVRLLMGSLALFLIGWLLLGQKLTGLPRYVLTSFQISNGYNLTMGTSAPREIRIAGVAAALLTLLAITARSLSLPLNNGAVQRRILLAAWLSFLAFLAWKHGFVRADGHEVFFFGFAAMLAVTLEALPSRSRLARSTGRVAAIAVVLLACATLEWRTPGMVFQRLSHLFEKFSGNLRTFVYSSPYKARLAKALAQQQQGNQLPRVRELTGPAATDVFGQDQAFAILNELNYHPRPVFQSYCAYTGPLMRLNQQFYERTNAPDFVLFNLTPVDSRLPALEDSGALRTLLGRYRPIETEGPFLLFQRSQHAMPRLAPLREGTARVGKPIRLPDSGSTDLWMEIVLRPTLAGHVQQFVYQPPMVYLCNWHGVPLQRGQEYRAPPPMLAAGFVVSPLLRDTFDVVDLFSGCSNARPAAISIEMSTRSRKFYQEHFAYRVYRIEPRLVDEPDPSLVRLKWPGFGSFPVEAVGTPNPICLASMGGKPAVCVQPWGHLKFAIPVGATSVSGAYGIEELAYTVGNTDGAEFRVELQSDDGSTRLLHSKLLEPKSKPEDRGLHSFSLSLPPGAHGFVVLRALAGPRNDTAWDLTCWTGVELK